MERGFSNVKIVVSDMDSTLSPTRMPLDSEMVGLIRRLLVYKDFAILSGNSFERLSSGVSGLLDLGETAPRIYLFPANATAMYMMGNGMWEPVYEERLGDPVKRRIFAAFARALKETGYEWPKDVYGEVIEDRGTQMTFSALGQLAPLEMKRRWDPDGRKRGEIMKRLARYLPDRVEARLGGTTSIDVTMRGIDKGYGIRKIMERLGYKKGEMLFIGNCLYKGGNDFPVIATGVRWMSVRGPQETKRILKRIIAESEGR